MIRVFVGMSAGAILGYVYYRFVGCVGGSCPMTRNPYTSSLYGAFLGALIGLGVK